MGFYDDMRGVADDILSEFAQGVVVLVRRTAPSHDADKPWRSVSASAVSYTLRATVRGVETRYVDGKTIVVGDRQITASPVALLDGAEVLLERILPDDVIMIDGRRQTVKSFSSIPEAGTPVAHRIFVGG